jgi:ABC-2 type transport system permease protein
MTPPDLEIQTASMAPPNVLAVDGFDESVPLRIPGRGPLSATRKYTNILRASLKERMAYRGDFLLGTILRFLPMVTTILLWKAVYEGSGKPTQAGFTYSEMIAYLLLTHISRMFSSMPNLAGGIARDIREGTLKRYLIQPVDLIGYLISYRVAHKVAYIVTSALPYGLLFWLCRGYFDRFPDPATFCVYLLSLVLAFLVGFFFEVCVGMVGFWFLEVTSLLYIVMTMNFFISGQMLPINLLPEPWFTILKWLPFQYMAYFPAMVFLGKLQGWDLVWGLVGEAGWAFGFLVLARFLYNRGLKRYGAYGG